MVVTILERKDRKAEQLRSATQTAMAVLTRYAAEHAGRFVVFGSAVRDDLRFDSDLDLIVDFPANLARPARDHAETVCRELGLRPDIHLIEDASPALLARVNRDGVILS